MPKEYVINHFSRNCEKIDECLHVLQNGGSPDTVINAYCYLVYRALEGKFTAVSLLFSKFEDTNTKLELIGDTQTKARWESSLITAYCYLYIKEKGADEELISLAKKSIREDIVQAWPRIMVNPVMLGLICMGYYTQHKKYTEANACLDAVFKVYQTAMCYSSIKSKHLSHFLIYEFKEATMLMGACILLGKLSGFELNYEGVVDLKKEIRNAIRAANSTPTYSESFYKTAPALVYIDN